MTFEEYAQKNLGDAGYSFQAMELIRMGWNARGQHGSSPEKPDSSNRIDGSESERFKKWAREHFGTEEAKLYDDAGYPVANLHEAYRAACAQPQDHIADASKMVPSLSRIAQKKLEQMGATVHGVLVKNEAGAWAAVSEAGRVMWLDGFEDQGGEYAAYLEGMNSHLKTELEAARAQSGQGVEAVAVIELSDYIHLSGASASQRKALKEVSEGSIQNLPVGTKLYTQPAQQGVPEGWSECLAEMVQAMHDYEMSVDEDAPYKHRGMMGRARALLSTPTTPQPEGDGWMPTLDWAVEKCRALQSQGFDRVRLDVLEKDLINAIEAHRPQPPQEGE